MPALSGKMGRTIIIATAVALVLLVVVRVSQPVRVVVAYVAAGFVLYKGLDDLGGGSWLDQGVALLAGSFLIVCLAALILGAISLGLSKLGLRLQLL